VPFIKADSFKCAINGVAYGPGTYWDLNFLEGTVKVTNPPSVIVVTSVTCGFENYVRVRFEKDVDNIFQVALHGTEVGELPSVSLIEDLTHFDWSQDYPMGGGIFRELPTFSRPTLNAFYGRVWYCLPLGIGCGVEVPSLISDIAKAGGPHFVVYNSSMAYDVGIYDEEGTLLATVDFNSCATLWIAPNSTGALEWVFA
jgi:hypothetical protein